MLVLSLALTALAATLIASVLLYRTIAGPMRRLSDAAERVSRSIGSAPSCPMLGGRTDEIGQMTTRLPRHDRNRSTDASRRASALPARWRTS